MKPKYIVREVTVEQLLYICKDLHGAMTDEGGEGFPVEDVEHLEDEFHNFIRQVFSDMGSTYECWLSKNKSFELDKADMPFSRKIVNASKGKH